MLGGGDVATISQTVTTHSVTVDELLRQFMAHVDSALALHAISVEQDGKSALTQLLSAGAERMVSENKLTPEDVGSAHHQVSLLTDATILRVRAGKKQAVTSEIIDKVKNFFCPDFFPFC